jgi:hypothetical protein
MPRPTVGALESSGDGCPSGTAFPTLGQAPDGQWRYNIIFSELEAATARATPNPSVECNLSVHATPALGYRMRIGSTIVQGTHLTRGGASTSLDGVYSWDTASAVQIPMINFHIEPARKVEYSFGHTVDHIPSTEGNWGATFESPVLTWSACNEDGGKTLGLSAGIKLHATRGSADQDAEIALQRSDVGMGWWWIFESCGFSGHWSSTYFVGGQTVPATLDVQGDHGTFRTAGFTGQLFDIKRTVREQGDSFDPGAFEEIGQTTHVHGRWSALRDDGWFDFDVNGDTFDGHWGTGENGPLEDHWRGRR